MLTRDDKNYAAFQTEHYKGVILKAQLVNIEAKLTLILAVIMAR
jgi:hypothetical protein